MNLRVFLRLQVIILLSLVVFILCAYSKKISIYRYNNKYSYNYIVQDNIQRLKEYYGTKKIVLLGGSSLGFSVSAKELSKKLGLLVLNLGVHAGFGRDNIWNMYKEFLNPYTDIIVVSPEYDIMGDISYKYNALYCDAILLGETNYLEKIQCLLSIVKMIVQTNTKKVPKHGKSIYSRKSFNEFGDVVAHYSLDESISPEKISVRTFEEKAFMEYYTFVKDAIIDKGFRVIYIPTAIPETSCGKNIERLVTLQNVLLMQFGSEYRTRSGELCFPDDFFFDTIYHANYKGMKKKTAIFEKVLREEYKKIGNIDNIK